MGALRAAQWQYDNQLPPAVSESAAEEAEARWIDDGIAELMARRDFVFQRNFRQRGVTYERFAQAVDEFVMGQIGQSGISNSVLGRLILAARCKSSSEAASAANEAMNVPNPDAMLQEIARTLLSPFAKEGVLAQAEDAE
ncbi:hypothetical protein [Pseudomonas sp. NBRC 111130]|uniref:hypothetical protein n=1 Tax=Pseudomonas sp. NBRC 111130 TaxID=1661045 RepID=UPI0006D3DC0A|nr:hypothetical protein [Pseudomonas sp. NBRC 111130]